MDATERKRIYGEVQQILADDLPYIPLWWWKNVIVKTSSLQGFVPYPDGDFTALKKVSFRSPIPAPVKRYLLQRSLLLLPTLFGALTLVFFLIHLVPGDPVEVMLGETASAADKEELRRSLALDQPLMVQYRSFLTGLLRGDLGQLTL